MEGQFAPGSELQEVKFAQQKQGPLFLHRVAERTGRQCHRCDRRTDLLDAKGKPIKQESWTIAYVDSEEQTKEDGTAENAIDGQAASFWHTQWGDDRPGHPHRLVIDLGRTSTLAGFRYLPRPGAGNVGGRIKDYRIYVDDGLIQQ